MPKYAVRARVCRAFMFQDFHALVNHARERQCLLHNGAEPFTDPLSYLTISLISGRQAWSDEAQN